MGTKLINKFREIQESEHKIWFTIEDIEKIINKYDSSADDKALIDDFLDSNCLEVKRDEVIVIRKKMDGDSTETLCDILENFLEYLKYHK